MVLISLIDCLNELDGIIFNDVSVGEVVRSLENLREYVVTYYKVEDKDDVFEILHIIKYILGNVKLDYIKNNFLNFYRQLRMLILNWHWNRLNIDHRRIDPDEDEDEVDE